MGESFTFRVLEAIHEVQRRYLEDAPHGELFDTLLRHLLDLSGSEYGFIGEVLRDEGVPYLRTHAITNIAWDEDTRRFHAENAPVGLEFHNLDTLFGQVLRTGLPLIANDPGSHPAAAGVPPGHPPLERFLGLPLYFRGELIGMVGVANREGGYDEELVSALEPFLTTCAHQVRAHRNVRQRRAAEAALVRSESSLTRLFDTGVLGVVYARVDGLITRANDRFLRMLGYEQQDLPLRWDSMTPEEWHATDREALEQLGLNGVAPPWEKELLHRDGHRVPILLGIAMLEGSADEGVAFVLDISRRKRMEAEQRELREQLRHSQRLEALGTVAAGMAHDFNNLLTAIAGWLDLARTHTPGAGPAADALDQADLAIGRGTDITRALLSFGSRGSSRLEPIDLEGLVRDSVTLLEAMLPSSIRLTLRSPRRPLWVLADSSSLQQVLINLALNARDAMESGGDLELSVEGPREGPGDVRVRVRDTGSGMDEETRQRAFDPFFTTKPRGRGTGLGLSMVHGLVQDLGGTVELHSLPGRGTEVEFRLPSCASPTAPGVEAAAPERAPSSRLILVAEDEPGIRTLVGMALERAGHQVLSAGDGREALAAVAGSRRPPDLAILDVDMPGLTGPACLARLREQGHAFPALLISGLPREGAQPADLEPLRFLPKPLRVADLLREVDELLQDPVPA